LPQQVDLNVAKYMPLIQSCPGLPSIVEAWPGRCFAAASGRIRAAIEAKPVKRMRTEREKVGVLLDRWKGMVTDKLYRNTAPVEVLVQSRRLSKGGQIIDDQDCPALIFPQVGNDAPILARHKLKRSPAEDRSHFGRLGMQRQGDPQK
jgi:hypothetical protein